MAGLARIDATHHPFPVGIEGDELAPEEL